jgi:hypothetical protein
MGPRPRELPPEPQQLLADRAVGHRHRADREVPDHAVARGLEDEVAAFVLITEPPLLRSSKVGVDLVKLLALA